jgi:hypothetical protein
MRARMNPNYFSNQFTHALAAPPRAIVRDHLIS